MGTLVVLSRCCGGTVSVINEITNPTSKDRCKDGGWMNYPQFKNQGQYVAHVDPYCG